MTGRRFAVVVNVPGYSPDGDPIICDTLADARDALSGELALTLETMGGDESAFDRAQAEVATLKPGESVTFAGYAHTITESEQ